MYLSTAFNITEKFSMKRALNPHTAATPAGFSGAIPERVAVKGRLTPSTTDPAIEPMLFVSVPIVSSAIQEGSHRKRRPYFN